jgi:F-type H+-transporting ATPase subunit a
MAAGFGVGIVSLVFTVFMSCLELLVAFLQAYVFTLLSAIYIGSAVEEHVHDKAHSH